MVAWLSGLVSDRKARLIYCACCRPDAAIRRNPYLLAALTVAERFADGECGDRELEGRHGDALELLGDPRYRPVVMPEPGACDALLNATHPAPGVLRPGRIAPPMLRGVLHCVIGNPFRPVESGPWITPAAVTVARDAYDRRDFAALPMLADLLEEAGCPDQTVLDHCRSAGPHARGCWVVDLVLDKA
jgi:hypothetical protein